MSHVSPQVTMKSCRRRRERFQGPGALGKALRDGHELRLRTPEAFQEEKLEAGPLQGRHMTEGRFSFWAVGDGDRGSRRPCSWGWAEKPPCPGRVGHKTECGAGLAGNSAAGAQRGGGGGGCEASSQAGGGSGLGCGRRRGGGSKGPGRAGSAAGLEEARLLRGSPRGHWFSPIVEILV